MGNLSLFKRFLIGAGIFLLYILAVIFGLFDGLLRATPVLAYVIAGVIGAVTAGIIKGRIPSKKVVEYSKDNFNKKQPSVIGYWTWIAMGAVFFIVWMIFKFYDL